MKIWNEEWLWQKWQLRELSPSIKRYNEIVFRHYQVIMCPSGLNPLTEGAGIIFKNTLLSDISQYGFITTDRWMIIDTSGTFWESGQWGNIPRGLFDALSLTVSSFKSMVSFVTTELLSRLHLWQERKQLFFNVGWDHSSFNLLLLRSCDFV